MYEEPTTADGWLERLEADVADYHPDMPHPTIGPPNAINNTLPVQILKIVRAAMDDPELPPYWRGVVLMLAQQSFIQRERWMHGSNEHLFELLALDHARTRLGEKDPTVTGISWVHEQAREYILANRDEFDPQPEDDDEDR